MGHSGGSDFNCRILRIHKPSKMAALARMKLSISVSEMVMACPVADSSAGAMM